MSPAAKQQAAAEVIFLTHNAALHEVNELWHPKGEELIWQPRLQEPKTSQNGAENVRYRRDLKDEGVAALSWLVREVVPWCRIRYAF